MSKKKISLSVLELEKLGITLSFPQNTDAKAEENSRRLAACWNACEGIITETACGVMRYDEAKKPMTLDDAIAHVEAKASNSPCGQEHVQLAVWLRDYRDILAKRQSPSPITVDLRSIDPEMMSELLDRGRNFYGELKVMPDKHD